VTATTSIGPAFVTEDANGVCVGGLSGRHAGGVGAAKIGARRRSGDVGRPRSRIVLWDDPSPEPVAMSVNASGGRRWRARVRAD